MFRDEGPRFSELSIVHEVRVSCAAFADITASGRICLIINRNRWKEKGELVLTPVGGAIRLTSEGIDELCSLLEIGRDAFEKEPDLRFIMHGRHANDLIGWFLRRQKRETSPDRELREELILETGLLTDNDLRGAKYGQPWYQKELAITDRAGQEGKLTLRLLEVYPTNFNKDTLAKLLSAAKQPDSMIRFVTDKEIFKGFNSEGIKIASVARTLIQPDNSIAKFL